MIKRNKLLLLSLFFLLLHPFYVYTLNTFKIYQQPLTIIAVVFFILFAFSNIKIHKKSLALCGPWFFLFIYMTLNNVGSIEIFFLYFICFAIMVVILVEYGWQESTETLLRVMVLPHAIFTIILFFIPSLYSFVQPFVAANNILYAGYKTALTGHYSTNAIYISIAFISYCCLLFYSEMSKKKKIYIVFFILSLFSLLLTAKRGPLLFSVAAIFITYLLVDKKRFSSRFIKILSVFLVSVLVLYLAGNFVPEISEFIARFSEDGDSGRSVMYLLAIQMFSKQPILGAGTGAYRLLYSTTLASDINHMYLNTHNVYLQLLAENGIIGFCLFLFASISTLYRGVTVLRKMHMMKNKNEKVMFTSVSFQIYFLLYCLTGNPLYDSMMFIPYFIFCAISNSLYIRSCYEQ